VAKSSASLPPHKTLPTRKSRLRLHPSAAGTYHERSNRQQKSYAIVLFHGENIAKYAAWSDFQGAWRSFGQHWKLCDLQGILREPVVLRAVREGFAESPNRDL